MKHLLVIIYLIVSGQSPIFENEDCLIKMGDGICYNKCSHKFVRCWNDDPEPHPEIMPSDTSYTFDKIKNEL